MRRIIFPLILGVMLLAGAWYGYQWWSVGRFNETTDNAFIEADIAVIAPRIAGYVTAVAVTDNQPVRPGQLLFTLDPRDLQAELARAEAEARRASLATGAAQANTATEASAIGEARARLAAARAAETQARADLQRIGAVYRRGFATKGVYDAAIAAAASRAADVAQAQAGIASQSSRRVAALSQGGGAGAALVAAEAEVETARLNLSYGSVIAPIEGVVGNRSVRVGQFVRAGQQTMVIVPVAQSYVVANFKETQIKAMAPGQRATLKLDAYPDQPLSGRILSFSPASGSRFSILPPENATGNFTKIVQRVPVKIAIEGPLPAGVRLAPGLSVKATVDLRSGGALAAR